MLVAVRGMALRETVGTVGTGSGIRGPARKDCCQYLVILMMESLLLKEIFILNKICYVAYNQKTLDPFTLEIYNNGPLWTE